MMKKGAASKNQRINESTPSIQVLILSQLAVPLFFAILLFTFCFVLFCFVLFCFVLFCFVLFFISSLFMFKYFRDDL